MDDDPWNDPAFDARSRAEQRRRLLARSIAVIVTFLVLVVLTRGQLAGLVPLLWPPTDPLAQWSMLLLLVGFVYVVVPLLVGSFLADVLLERVR